MQDIYIYISTQQINFESIFILPTTAYIAHLSIHTIDLIQNVNKQSKNLFMITIQL